MAESFDIAKLRRELDPTFYHNKKLMSDQVRPRPAPHMSVWRALF